MDSSTTQPSNPESREALLQELALRLATSPFDPRPRGPQLFVGQLPDTLPFDVPIPEGCRIIGSLARSDKYLDILLDVPLPPEQALAFYRERLLAAGWAEPQNMRVPPHGGFVHVSHLALSHSALFCKGPRGPALNFMARAAQADVTDVRLDLNLEERESPCAHTARMRREEHVHGMGVGRLIPPLAPPAGAQQMGGGGGGGLESWHTSASLEADGDLATLAAHYASQLEQGGWTRTDSGQQGPVAWHAWTFQDEDQEPWYGFFFMHQVPGKPRNYSLYLRIEWAKSGEPMAGWFSYAPL